MSWVAAIGTAIMTHEMAISGDSLSTATTQLREGCGRAGLVTRALRPGCLESQT